MQAMYRTYSFNWLLIVENKGNAALWVDYITYPPQLIKTALDGMKAEIFPDGSPALFLSTTRFLPLTDTIMSNLDKKLSDSRDEYLRADTRPLEEVFRSDTLIFDDEALAELDLVSPSLLHLENLKNNPVSFYVLPVQISCLDQGGDDLLRISALLDSSDKINSVIGTFMKTPLASALTLNLGRAPAVLPLWQTFDTRKILAEVRQLARKNG